MGNNQSNNKLHDVVIIGGGAAGLTAGIYVSRANLKALLIESPVSPSQITITDLIENYPGFPDGLSGFELIERFRQQAAKFGLEIITQDVISIKEVQTGDIKGWEIATDDEILHALSVIIATGSSPMKLNVPGEEEFAGKGVSYCATCDAPFYRDKDVMVVGGGDTAIQEALFLTGFAKKVTIVHRRERLRATAFLQDKAFADNKIGFAWNSIVEEILGDTFVTGVRLKNISSPDEHNEIPADGVFIFTGFKPNTDIVRGIVDMNESGYIEVDSFMKASHKGIFACGDCTDKLLRQVITACGDGATAAFAAQLYIEYLKDISYDNTYEQIENKQNKEAYSVIR